MNNVVLVGRLTDNPTVTEKEGGLKVTSINVAVTRNYKNADGIYETDFIRCILWNAIAENVTEYCHVGDVIGVKGRLQTSQYDDENGKRHFVTDVIAERITFLSSRSITEINDMQKGKDNSNKKCKKKNDKKVD